MTARGSEDTAGFTPFHLPPLHLHTLPPSTLPPSHPSTFLPLPISNHPPYLHDVAPTIATRTSLGCDSIHPAAAQAWYIQGEDSTIRELKDEASKDLPEGCPFVSTLDALTARIQQVFGNMPLRGSPPPPIRMSQSINVRIGKRLTDPANPDVDLLPSPDVLGNW
eukprot:365961-Chlamydomonas_euryale.AAC.11